MKKVGFILLGITILAFVLLFKQRSNKEKYQKKAFFQPITVHEIDQNIINKIDHAIKKIELLQKRYYNKKQVNQLHNWYNKLTTLKKEYSYVSPALIALGPIGTTSIVLKEEKIEKQLEKLIRKIELFELKNQK